jgi:hypothetical protein
VKALAVGLQIPAQLDCRRPDQPACDRAGSGRTFFQGLVERLSSRWAQVSRPNVGVSTVDAIGGLHSSAAAFFSPSLSVAERGDDRRANDTMVRARECRGFWSQFQPWPRFESGTASARATRHLQAAAMPRSHTHGEPGPPASDVTATSTPPRAGPIRRTVRAQS